MKRKNPEALTDDEVSLLRSDKTPSTIKNFVARQHADVGLRTTAYRKVAAAARAEREAITEVILLEAIRTKAGLSSPPEAREVFELQEKNRELATKVQEQAEALNRALAMPAMAVSGD